MQRSSLQHRRPSAGGQCCAWSSGHITLQLLLMMAAATGLVQGSNSFSLQNAPVAMNINNALHTQTQSIDRGGNVVGTDSTPAQQPLASMSQQHATLAQKTLDSLGTEGFRNSSSHSITRGSSRSLRAVLQGGGIPVTRYAHPQ